MAQRVEAAQESIKPVTVDDISLSRRKRKRVVQVLGLIPSFLSTSYEEKEREDGPPIDTELILLVEPVLDFHKRFHEKHARHKHLIINNNLCFVAAFLGSSLIFLSAF